MSDSDVYTAERIHSKRKRNGVTQYLIKWKGYSLKKSTWEPEENIIDRNLITDFENRKASRLSSKATHKSKRAQLIVLNPQGSQAEEAVLENIVFEPVLTKESIIVTDVTLDDFTVTISECKTPEGFFRNEKDPTATTTHNGIK
jgi:hypothetical protein